MKQAVSPAVAGVVIAIILVVAVIFLYKQTAGPGGPAPGQVGNASPFAPGGAAVTNPQASRPSGGSQGANPFAPGGGGAPGKTSGGSGGQ